MGCHFLLWGISLTQGSNPGLLQYRHILYCLSHQRPSGLKYYQNGECDSLLKRIPIYQPEKRTALVVAGATTKDSLLLPFHSFWDELLRGLKFQGHYWKSKCQRKEHLWVKLPREIGLMLELEG